MKTAILISGHMRSFDLCLPNLAWMVFRHFPDADFFISTEPDEDAPKAELLRAKFPKARVEIDMTPQPPMDVPAGEPWRHAPYAISVPPDAVLGQLWRLQRCWDFMDGDGGQALDYDLVIRCRPDLWMHSFEPVHGLDVLTACVPWWGRFGGINDRFAILGTVAAAAYFETFCIVRQHLKRGCPLHPESLIHASLAGADCEIDATLRAEFSKMGRDRKIERWPEISTIDLAHAAMKR